MNTHNASHQNPTTLRFLSFSFGGDHWSLLFFDFFWFFVWNMCFFLQRLQRSDTFVGTANLQKIFSGFLFPPQWCAPNRTLFVILISGENRLVTFSSSSYNPYSLHCEFYFSISSSVWPVSVYPTKLPGVDSSTKTAAMGNDWFADWTRNHPCASLVFFCNTLYVTPDDVQSSPTRG